MPPLTVALPLIVKLCPISSVVAGVNPLNVTLSAGFTVMVISADVAVTAVVALSVTFT